MTCCALWELVLRTVLVTRPATGSGEDRFYAYCQEYGL